MRRQNAQEEAMQTMQNTQEKADTASTDLLKVLTHLEMAAHLGGVKLFQAAKNSKITSFILPNRHSASAKSTGHSVRNFWPRRNL